MTDHSTRRQEALVDQQEAIRDYLDALLQDIPDVDDEPPRVVQAQPTATDVRPMHEEPATATAAAVREPTPDLPVPDPEPRVMDTETGTEAAPVQPEETEQQPEEHAERDAVQALFFDVGGLRLAVPLTELHSVVPWGDVDVTAMPRQSEWQLGLMRYRERNVRLVDTVAMVLPPDKRHTPEAQAQPKHILVVGDGSWGMTCHAIGDVVRLGPGEVKWRRRGSARPWLAGTVIGHLSAVIDTSAFARMLEHGNDV